MRVADPDYHISQPIAMPFYPRESLTRSVLTMRLHDARQAQLASKPAREMLVW